MRLAHRPATVSKLRQSVQSVVTSILGRPVGDRYRLPVQIEALEARRLLSVTIPAGYQKVDALTMTLQASNAAKNGPQPVTSAQALASGVSYFVKASGTYQCASPPARLADAGYHQRNGALTVWDANGSGLTVGGISSWGSYDAQHEYGGYLTGNGQTVTGQIIDSLYSDNGGSMTVEFYKKLPTVSLANPTAAVEGGQKGGFDITRTGDLSSSITVQLQYYTVNGQSGLYTYIPANAITFAANQSTKHLAVWAVNDHHTNDAGRD